MKREEIEALPNDPAALKRRIVQMYDIIASHELARALRARADAEAQASPAADFDVDVLNAKAELEGLADGAVDFNDPRERARVTGIATRLLDRMWEALRRG